jgi:hypothetical protein
VHQKNPSEDDEVNEVSVSQYVNRFLAFFGRGKLTVEETNAANIPSVNHSDARTTPKDQRVLHQQKAVVLNSLACVAAYRD